MTARRIAALLAATVLSAGALAACSGSDGDAPAEAAAAQTEPDLEGVPAVVAVVDGTDITRDEFVTSYEAQFRLSSAQAQQTGQPIDQDQLKQQVAESLVSTQLLVAEADRRDYTVTEKDIDATLAQLTEESGLGSTEELLASLAEQGVDGPEADRQLEQQVKVDRLVAEEGGDTDPTEAEVRALYDQAVAQQQDPSAEVPSFEDARDQLEDQLRSQAETTAAQQLVEDLRADAEVTINL